MDLDAALYQAPFFTIPEKREISRFQTAGLLEKIKLFESGDMSPRVNLLACRILFRNYAESMTPSIVERRDAYMKKARNRNIPDVHGGMKIDENFENSNMDKVENRKCEKGSEQKHAIVGYKNDYRLTPDKALEEIRFLSGEKIEAPQKNMNPLDAEQLNIMAWLKDYIESF